MSKIKIALQVSAGYRYALILKQDGSLYGIGDNSSGQICSSGQSRISPPAPVAAHVKAFAAGCNYSIYVTESGEVKLVGSGKYTERFPGFQNAQDVYARSGENVFLIEDSHGKWFAFGDNLTGKITSLKAECLYQFPEEAYTDPPCYIYGTEGPDKALQNGGGASRVHNECSHEKYQAVVRTAIFQNLSKIYGSENLTVDLNETGKGTCRYNSGAGGNYSFVWDTTYAPRIMRDTRSIYNPTECDYDSIADSADSISDVSFPDAEKIVTVDTFTFILKGNNKLSVLNHNSHEETFLLDDIYDISMTHNCVIISKLDGKVLFGAEESASLFYRDWDIGHLNAYTV